ncbi:MAG: LysM peptidoglycan-binding domain-containing protein [Heliobacteriaceae bacterium]|nr:LysM peptidoglycan-binding domain-containing protein [Heliobacteriaceae bacterium]
MKSSTIRRSNLSKEKMAVIEALSKYRQESAYDSSPNVYVRSGSHVPAAKSSREEELDRLWRNFRISQRTDKSPNVYVAAGFIAGAVVMLALSALISFSARGIDNHTVIKPKKAKMSVNLIPSSAQKVQATASEVYTVQSGDTMESIQMRFYGLHSPEKLKTILEANGIDNPHKLSIGQKLTIPMD